MSDYVSCPTCHGKGLVPLEEAARIEQHENAFVEQARARGAQPPSADRFPKGPRTVQVRYVKRDDEQPKGLGGRSTCSVTTRCNRTRRTPKCGR